MKLSKSILGPVRATRDFSFLSRRLRSNGSQKGGILASPFGKKRGCALEGHEPSSPKVTCIGQVRVKSKRKAKAKQCRSLSRRGDFGEASFRRMDGSQSQGDGSQQSEYNRLCSRRNRERNQQRWVHLPMSICEALRAELCCLFSFPCRRCCCLSTVEKRERCCGNGRRACGAGAVFCRWLLCVSDGGGGRKREIEVVVAGGVGGDGGVEVATTSSRRHVFDDIEVRRDGSIGVKGGSNSVEDEEEAPRVSICIPPKNALLLMRCRSDPMKMAALANRISWAASNYEHGDDYLEDEEECSAQQNQEEEARAGGICEDRGKIFGVSVEGLDQAFEEQNITIQREAAEPNLEMEVRANHDQEELDTEEMKEQETDELKKEVLEQQQQQEDEEEVESNMSSFEALLLVQENTEQYRHVNQQVEENPICHSSSSLQSDSNEEEEEEEEAAATESQQILSLPCKQELMNKQEMEELIITSGESESDKGGTNISAKDCPNPPPPPPPQIHQDDVQQVKKNDNVLPDCLLLMMCEPKLSMEVSKETWVRGTDFIRWLPPRKPAKSARTACCHHEPLKRRPPPPTTYNDSKPKASPPSLPKKNDHQPARSSCSLPAPSNVLEQKPAGGTYEPLVLTRCKSEPMRTATELMPESLFRKNANLKLEPHRHRVATLGVSVGVGAAGIS